MNNIYQAKLLHDEAVTLAFPGMFSKIKSHEKADTAECDDSTNEM